MRKEYIEINGTKQGLIIESLDKEKPLLLLLHGGPGFPIYPFIKAHNMSLEKFFNVCYWDQRGTGMSYNPKVNNSLTVDQLTDDTIRVAEYLLESFSHEKLFLFGHSWGTYLGSLVANKRPNLFHAYIGVGQIGSSKDSEKETYQFILNMAKRENDKHAVKLIETVVFDDHYYKNRTYGSIRAKYTNKYGGGFVRQGYTNLENMKHVFRCPNYTIKERLNVFRGSLLSYLKLGPVMATTDLVELVPSLSLPVFIFHGVHDYQTTYTQAKRFYDSVKAPAKEMYTFEHSSHTPFVEEQDRFMQFIQDDVITIM